MRQGWKRWAAAALVAPLLALASACSTFEKDPTAKWDADRLYQEARTEMSAGNWQAARQMLEKLEARFPFTRHAQQAQMEIAYTYYKENEPAQAITAAERFLKLNPNHQNADYVLYLKGLAIFSDDLGLFGRALGYDPADRDPKAMREAFETYKELVTRFPASRYAADATARMNWLVDGLARNEVHVAQYYLRRGAYVAAIQRAQNALREYQGTPATEQALVVMMRAYEALGMKDLSADAQRVLQRNFPDSTALQPRR